MTDNSLYESIKNYKFDGEYNNVDITFEYKLYDANLGWSVAYTYKVIEEYKKFMYLCSIYKNVAPPDPIDQVWHQHILYTIDYAKFCEKYIGFFAHHNPERFNGTKNGVNVYDLTLKNYIAEFNQEPPCDVWVLNANEFKRVNFFEHYIVPINDLKSIIKVFFNELKQKTKLWNF